MTVQILDIAGQKMALLPVADYERLIELAEDKEDLLAAERAEQRRREGEEYLPAAMVDRMLAGEPPLKVWREHRRLTMAELAGRAGISVSYLCDIENGKRRGSVDRWRRIAAALDLMLEDILPEG